MQKIVCVRHNDCTSVMSGANSYLLTYLKLFVIRSHSIYVKMLNSGVQKLFREEAAPEITYIHCYNHRLNWYLWMLLSLSRLQTSSLDCWNPYVFMASAVTRVVPAKIEVDVTMTVVVVVVQITIFSLKESFDSSKFAETGDSLLVESRENSRLKEKEIG